MQILKQATQIKVRLGAFVASTDGVTPTTSATISAADQAEVLKANGAATVALTTSDVFAAVSGAKGWYDLTLTTGHTNTVGTLEVVLQDSSAYCPVLGRFQVLEESVYDALFGSGAAYPTNFASLVVSTAGQVQASNVLTTGDFPANFDNLTVSTAGAVTVGTNNDKTGYSLTQGFPTNFANMALTSGGAVTVGTNQDKTGYELSQSFPTNFASMVISGSGAVDSLVQGFLNHTLTEATTGRIANNFNTFYENANAQTTKVVDDVGTAVSTGGGGGGLTTGDFPANFDNLSITTDGKVQVTQAFPTNFSSLLVSTAGQVQSSNVLTTGDFPANFDALSITTAGIVSSALSAAERNSVADVTLSRSVSNVQSTAGNHSITSIVLAMLESSLSTGGTWTIKTTTGGTHMTQTATLTTAGKSVTAVS